jgi:hypothetical protein
MIKIFKFQVNLEARRRHRESNLPPLKTKSVLPPTPPRTPTPPLEETGKPEKEEENGKNGNGNGNGNHSDESTEEEDDEESEKEEESEEKEEKEDVLKKENVGGKKISDFFKKFNMNKSVDVVGDVHRENEDETEGEGASPNRDGVTRQKKRVTFFGRNNNVNKKTSNESRQTSLIDESVIKNTKTNGNEGVTQKKSDDNLSDDSSSGEDKIRKISDEPAKTSTVISRIGEKRSKACTIV